MPRYIDGPEVKFTRRDGIFVDAEFYSGEKFEGLELHRMFPITGLSRYISLIDSEGEEIAVIRNIDNLLPESKEAVEQCLDEYYNDPADKAIHKDARKIPYLDVDGRDGQGNMHL